MAPNKKTRSKSKSQRKLPETKSMTVDINENLSEDIAEEKTSNLKKTKNSKNADRARSRRALQTIKTNQSNEANNNASKASPRVTRSRMCKSGADEKNLATKKDGHANCSISPKVQCGKVEPIRAPVQVSQKKGKRKIFQQLDTFSSTPKRGKTEEVKLLAEMSAIESPETPKQFAEDESTESSAFVTAKQLHQNTTTDSSAGHNYETPEQSPVEARISQIQQASSSISQPPSCDTSQSFNKTAGGSEHACKEPLPRLLEILSGQWTNVSERMKLNYTPRCSMDAENFDYCRAFHLSKSPRYCNVWEISDINGLIDQDHYMNAIKRVESACRRKEFPGDDILMSLANIIMTTNAENDDDGELREILSRSFFLFKNLLHTFPPCWTGVRSSYERFLKAPIKMRKYEPGKCDSDGTNLLTFILSKLDETIAEPETEHEFSSQESSQIISFPEWEERYMHRNIFSALPRRQKLNRLFDMLELLTTLFEMDVAMFVLHKGSHGKEHLFSEEEEQPLIVGCFEMTLYSHLTNLVKNTLKLFVTIVLFKFPAEQTEILSRLISVLATVMNICDMECDESGEKTKFPHFGENTKEFAKEILKTINNFQYFDICMKDYFTVFDRIRLPYIKYYVIDHFLVSHRLHVDGREMCPEKVARCFRKEPWNKFSSEPLSQGASETLGESPPHKYPIVNKEARKKSRRGMEVSQGDYLKLWLDALKSYCDTFKPKDVYEIFNERYTKECVAEPSQRRGSLREKTRAQIKSIKFDGLIVDNDLLNKYRSDIKHLGILFRFIPAWQQKCEAAQFSDFMTFLGEFFEKVI